MWTGRLFEHRNILLGSMEGRKFLISWVNISFLGRSLPHGISYVMAGVKASYLILSYLISCFHSCQSCHALCSQFSFSSTWKCHSVPFTNFNYCVIL